MKLAAHPFTALKVRMVGVYKLVYVMTTQLLYGATLLVCSYISLARHVLT